MAPEDVDVKGGLVKIDNITLEQVRALDDTVIGNALRGVIDTSEKDPHDVVAEFGNYI